MIITQFYSKLSPVIQATMDKHKGQIVSLQDLVTFCNNLEKELKIQDELFEQCLQKHHRLAMNEAKPPEQISHVDTMEIFENNISTLSATDRTPGFFRQLTPKENHVILGMIWARDRLKTPSPCVVSSDDTSSSISIEPAIVNPRSEHFLVVVINNSNEIVKVKYVPGKENAFADFLGGKYEVDQTDTNHTTTSKAAEAMDLINVVETRAKTRQKLARTPQTDLEVPEIPEEDMIVDPANLPNQDQWPFTQQQIVDAQKVDPMLDQTCQKVENQVFSLDMQSLAGASGGGMRRKRSYVDPIFPTHNRTLQTNRHCHNSDIHDTDLDMYKVPANKLPFSSRATFNMWQEATKRYMCHIDQEAVGSHCSS
uniref:Uncharacterized protein n=1 Tax=Romanomermis culicivorax TaxID=13658 RepID=A0A915JWG6_ROMCU